MNTYPVDVLGVIWRYVHGVGLFKPQSSHTQVTREMFVVFFGVMYGDGDGAGRFACFGLRSCFWYISPIPTPPLLLLQNHGPTT